MTILMTGGTGFLGSALRARLEEDGHHIVCLSRSKSGAIGATSYVPIEALNQLESQEAVINLAGESVVGLWTTAKRQAIYDSRIGTTHKLAAWIDGLEVKPKVFLSGSAVGIYGDCGDRVLTEDSDVSSAQGFLAKVCRDWEQAASSAAWRGTRTVFLRTGHVLDPSGGLLAQVLPMMRKLPILGLGPSKSYLPWISLADWIGLSLFALENEALSGPFNLTAPNPATQQDFTQAIATRFGKRVWGRIPGWMLGLAAGDFGRNLAFSQRAVPEKALDAGYAFEVGALSTYPF